MQGKKIVSLFLLSVMFVFASCAGEEKQILFEISDLNGTWQPDQFYNYIMTLSEEERREKAENMPLVEFSWGFGALMGNISFEIDITALMPFFRTFADGRYILTEITMIEKNFIKATAHTPSGVGPYEVIFHFIDRDTIWINSELFGYGNPMYGENAFWHRLSGVGVVNTWLRE